MVQAQMASEQKWSRLADWCRAQPVRLCVLFGSQATGRTHSDSDVDLAIWPDCAPDPMGKARWIGELSDLLNLPVNLVIGSADLDPVLGFEIMRDGQAIFEREPGVWQAQAVQLWHAYNDSLPFRRAAREQLRRFAAEVRRGA